MFDDPTVRTVLKVLLTLVVVAVAAGLAIGLIWLLLAIGLTGVGAAILAGLVLIVWAIARTVRGGKASEH